MKTATKLHWLRRIYRTGVLLVLAFLTFLTLESYQRLISHQVYQKHAFLVRPFSSQLDLEVLEKIEQLSWYSLSQVADWEKRIPLETFSETVATLAGELEKEINQASPGGSNVTP